jgi:RHS repeat-associated protein
MGGGVGGLLYSARAESGTGLQPVSLKYNLSNGRGDIVAQSDSTGTLTWTASYEAYGKRTKETGTNADKQRANTKDEDPTGLLNEGFRYRDIETGVWLSRDPAGFVDGPNLYAYVMQNPWSKWDPDGLWWRDALSAGLDFIPVVSTIKTAVEFVAGQDLITGEAISRAESAAGLGASFIPGGKGAMKIAKMGAKMGGTSPVTHHHRLRRRAVIGRVGNNGEQRTVNREQSERGIHPRYATHRPAASITTSHAHRF